MNRVVEWYEVWAAQKPVPKALVVYDTMWRSTDAMADAIVEGVRAESVAVQVLRARNHHRSSIAAEYLESGALVVGTPTLNGCMFPTLADVLSYLKGLKRKNLIGAVFGSYGWNGEGVVQVKDALAAMKIPLVAEPISVQYVPDEAALERCRALGREVALKLKEIC
ncbi:MAG: flavodoxin domain-containing protein [Candidatus Hydrogenedentes bacterium]|nr:flavodoxin domain-containing protein [Candidatus Hydrogenedentota bacterium]